MVTQAPITPQQARKILDRSQDGVWFIRNVLGHRMWRIPEEIVRELAKPRAMVAVKSCHASSKTFTAADITIWATAALGGQVLVTSPSWTQVEQQIWGEIRKTYKDSSLPLGGEMLKTEWRLGPMNYALGMATNDGIRIQGFHGRPLFVLVDEATGVRPDIFHAIEGMRAGGDVRVIMFANPNDEMTAFREAFTEGRSIWKTFTIDGLYTPNLAGVSLEELAAIPYTDDTKAEFHPLLDDGDPFFKDHLISRRFVWEKYHTWGVNNPLWVTKVRGQFPEAGTNTLIGIAWMEQAKDRISGMDKEPIDVGIDVAGPGEDETVLQPRQGSNVLPMKAWADPDPRGAVAAELQSIRDKGQLRNINVDTVGQGYYFARHLEDLGFTNVVHINVGERAYDPERFANLKAEYYWGLRERFEQGDIHGVTDDVQQSQLVSLRYGHTARGQVEIESKEKARKRGIKSPDRAEALMLAFAVGSTLRDGSPLIV